MILTLAFQACEQRDGWRESAAAIADCPPCQVADDGGVCNPAAFGTDPKGDCAFDLGACRAASCDGRGSCALADGVACAATDCENRFRYQCSSGTCGAGYFQCGVPVSTGEVVPCGVDADCVPADPCQPLRCDLTVGGVCKPKVPRPGDGTPCGDGGVCRHSICALGDGADCTSNEGCRSGLCFAGSCFNASADPCPPCQIARNGACVAAPFGSDPKHDCIADPKSCRGDSCDGRGGCAVADGVRCADDDCDAGTSFACANGGCAAQALGNRVCGNGDVLLRSCTRDQDCGGDPCMPVACDNAGMFPTYTCFYWGAGPADGTPCGDGGVCRDHACGQPLGASCARPSECQSELCAQTCRPFASDLAPPDDLALRDSGPDDLGALDDLASRADLQPLDDLPLRARDLSTPGDLAGGYLALAPRGCNCSLGSNASPGSAWMVVLLALFRRRYRSVG